MRFASFFSGGLITTIVVNQLERKLAKRTSMRSTARNFMVCIKLSQDFFRSKSGWEWKICPKNIEDFAKIATWNLTNANTLWDCSSAICSWRCKSFSSLGLLAKKSPRTKKAHWNEIFLMKHSIYLCFHEMFMEHFCDNYVPQCWVEFNDELSWLFTKRFQAFYLICWK